MKFGRTLDAVRELARKLGAPFPTNAFEFGDTSRGRPQGRPLSSSRAAGTKPPSKRSLKMMGDHRNVPKKPRPEKKVPAAGPHDKPELTDPEKAPGTGILPGEDVPEVEGPTG